jgi:voltage-gated potassium channel
VAERAGPEGVFGRLSRRFLILTFVATAVLVICPILFWAFEHNHSPDVRNVGTGFQWVSRTLFETTSAYKIHTGPGFAVYYLVRVAGVSLVAFASGTIASRLVNNVILKGRGMGSTKQAGHIVICGWSSKGAEIIRELRAKEVEDTRRIVVLARLESDPTREDDVEFLRGDPSDEVDLRRAGIDVADTAIILADESTPSTTAGDRDARTLLTCLAVESLNPDVYTCVEVIRSENRQHFARTHANELVVSAELTGALLAGSATTHGLSRLVADLVTHPEGNEFYRVPAPPAVVGKTVQDAMALLKGTIDATLIAVLSDGVRFDVNPKAARVITASDQLVVIASEPVTL